MSNLLQPYIRIFQKSKGRSKFNFGPTGLNSITPSGLYHSTLWEIRENPESFYSLYKYTSDDLSPSIFVTGFSAASQITSFCFNNSGELLYSHDYETNSLIKNISGVVLSIVNGREGQLLNSNYYNQPFTGVDLSSPIFSSGNIMCFTKNGASLNVRVFDNSFSPLIESYLLETPNKLINILPNNIYATGYPAFSLCFFLETKFGAQIIQTNFLTNLSRLKIDNFRISYDGLDRLFIDLPSSTIPVINSEEYEFTIPENLDKNSINLTRYIINNFSGNTGTCNVGLIKYFYTGSGSSIAYDQFWNVLGAFEPFTSSFFAATIHYYFSTNYFSGDVLTSGNFFFSTGDKKLETSGIFIKLENSLYVPAPNWFYNIAGSGVFTQNNESFLTGVVIGSVL